MTEIIIEPMRGRHIPEILEIEKYSFTTPWSSISFQNELYNPYGIGLVALADDTVIAYIVADYRFEEGHILNVAVHPAYRRKGIARRLLDIVLGWLKEKECRFIYLEVRTSNLAARKLYESLGFREVGRRKFYYMEPSEDAVLMTLEVG